MKAILSILAASFIAATSAQAVIVFNPANQLNVVDEGGFVGSATGVADPFSQAQVRFNFTGLNPSPLPSSFQITNIFLKGDGIATSLSFSDITITGNGTTATAYVNLNTTLTAAFLANSLVSFDLPGGNVITDGAVLSVGVRYSSAAPDFNNQVTSSTGPVFDAEAPAPVPEPGTWAAAALLAGGAAFARWRKRAKVS
jgi:hypothetical protein